MEQRARRIESLVIWVFTIVLAAVFLVTGGAKLLGGEPFALQAAAMRGFPGWIRTLVGLVEIAGAVALLIPRVSAPAATMLALLMVPATLTQWVSGEPGLFVPVVVLVLLVFVAWRRNPAVARRALASVWETPRPLLREAVTAGLIGAAIIAVWFFLVDLIAGRPLFTPATLGRALVSVVGFGPPESTFAAVAIYTVFHVAAFLLVGLLAVLIVDTANREPSILFGFIVLFAAMEVGFYAFVSLLQQATSLGALAWYNVMIGNLLAVGAMATFLVRAHPALREQFRHSLDAPALSR